jgi:hypothetical protein
MDSSPPSALRVAAPAGSIGHDQLDDAAGIIALRAGKPRSCERTEQAKANPPRQPSRRCHPASPGLSTVRTARGT